MRPGKDKSSKATSKNDHESVTPPPKGPRPWAHKARSRARNSKSVSPAKPRSKANDGKKVIKRTSKPNKVSKNKFTHNQGKTHDKEKSSSRKRGRSMSTHRSEKRPTAVPKKEKKRKPSVSISTDSTSESGASCTLVERLDKATIDSLKGRSRFRHFSRTQFLTLLSYLYEPALYTGRLSVN